MTKGKSGHQEKHKPHYDLKVIKEMVRAGALKLSKHNAVESARQMGLNPNKAIKEAILDLRQKDFKVSRADWMVQGEWQDAYITTYQDKKIYIKFSMRDIDGRKVLVTSFKNDMEE